MNNKLKIIRGDTITIPLTITDSNGSAVDLTGATIFFTIKENLNDADSDALLQKNVTSHVSDSGGLSQIDLATTDTNLSEGTYYYDIQIKFSSGAITSTQPQTLKVYQDVTRRVS